MNLPNDSEWTEAIRSDQNFGKIYRYLKDKELPDDDSLASKIIRESTSYRILDDGVLYRNTKVNPKDKNITLRRCLPNKFRPIILNLYHDTLWAGGHLGKDKTYNKIWSEYFSPKLMDYVKYWCNTCIVCKRTKRKYSSITPEKGMIYGNEPFDLLCIDHWDPCVKDSTARGNSYVLSCIDAYTKFAWGIPIQDGSAEKTAEALYFNIFTKCPMYKRIHSDRGEAFIGKVMDRLAQLFQIKRSATSSYHPEGNGTIERIHQFFRNAITAYLNRYDQRDWDLILPAVVKIYNDACHTALGRYSPSEMIFGRKLGDLNYEPLEGINPDFYVEKLRLGLAHAQEIVTGKYLTKKDKLDKENDEIRKNKLTRFEVGDRVGMSVEELPSGPWSSIKLFPRYRGPFVVNKVVSNGRAYYITNLATGDDEKHPVPASRLIPFDVRDMDENFEESDLDDDSEDSDDLPSVYEPSQDIDLNRLHSAEKKLSDHSSTLRVLLNPGNNVVPSEDSQEDSSDDEVEDQPSEVDPASLIHRKYPSRSRTSTKWFLDPASESSSSRAQKFK